MKREKEVYKNLKTNSKGITVIALAITIIVLLILAGVSIAAITSDNGIIKQAQNAKEEIEKANMEERIDQVIIQVEGTHRNPTLEDIIDGLLKEDIIATRDDVNKETGSITTKNPRYVIEGKLDDYLEKTQDGRKYTVTYNYAENGGSSSTKTTDTIQSGSKIDLSPTATKQGYEFVGWNTDKNATSKIENLNMGTSDITLYAIYSKTITITFNYYNGRNTETINKPVMIYNKNTSTDITVLTIGNINVSGETYYTRGWSTEKSGNARIEVLPNETVNVSTDKTYYASYSKTVTVSYNADGGTGEPDNQTGTVYMNYAGEEIAATITISSQTPSKAGWNFSYWYGDAKTYLPSETISIYRNLELVANWQMPMFTIYIDGVQYGLDSGMNWRKWVESSYNTGGFVIAPNGNVMDSSYTKIVYDSTNNNPVNEYQSIQRFINFYTK